MEEALPAHTGAALSHDSAWMASVKMPYPAVTTKNMVNSFKIIKMDFMQKCGKIPCTTCCDLHSKNWSYYFSENLKQTAQASNPLRLMAG